MTFWTDCLHLVRWGPQHMHERGSRCSLTSLRAPGWALMHAKQLPHPPSAAPSRAARHRGHSAPSASNTNLSAPRGLPAATFPLEVGALRFTSVLCRARFSDQPSAGCICCSLQSRLKPWVLLAASCKGILVLGPFSFGRNRVFHWWLKATLQCFWQGCLKSYAYLLCLCFFGSFDTTGFCTRVAQYTVPCIVGCISTSASTASCSLCLPATDFSGWLFHFPHSMNSSFELFASSQPEVLLLLLCSALPTPTRASRILTEPKRCFSPIPSSACQAHPSLHSALFFHINLHLHSSSCSNWSSLSCPSL